jgi:hypothetical protein
MTGLHTRVGQDGGLVPRYLARLQEALGGVTEQARDALARTLAGAAADLVGQAVRAAPGNSGDGPDVDPWGDRRRATPAPVTDPFEELYGSNPEDPEGRWYRNLSPPRRPRPHRRVTRRRPGRRRWGWGCGRRRGGCGGGPDGRPCWRRWPWAPWRRRSPRPVPRRSWPGWAWPKPCSAWRHCRPRPGQRASCGP